MGRPRIERRKKSTVLLGQRLKIRKLLIADFDKGGEFLGRLHQRSGNTVFYVERPNGATIVLVPRPFTKYGQWLIELLIKEFGWRRDQMGGGFVGPFGKIFANWRVQDVHHVLTNFRI